MSALALPARPRRRAALDPRLLIGLVLVLGSIAGVVGLVRAAGTTTPVYAAAHPLLPGQHIDAGDLVLRHVALDGADARYLREDRLPAGGAVVLATVRTGELVPLATLGAAATAGDTSIVLQLGGPVAASVVPGANVQLWSSPPSTASSTAAQTPPTPTILADSATVVSVSADSSLVARSSATVVELLVPRDRISALLTARSAGDTITVLPLGVPLGAGS